jgi:excisionase family DNA binding protein
MTAPTANEYMLAEEVARELRVPVATLRWWVRTGKLRAIRPGRRLLIRRSDLEAFLSEMTVRPSPRNARPPLRVVPNELDRKRAEEALRRLGL